MKGFTLLELVVVFAVLAIISTVGVVSFTNYNKSQELSQAVSGIVNFLNMAKSNSLSQIKPDNCALEDLGGKQVYTLEGYEVTISAGTDGSQSSLRFQAKCSGNYFGTKTLTLPKNIKIVRVTPDETFFYPLFQEPETVVFQGSEKKGIICVEGYGVRKEISVSNLGTITLLNPTDVGFSCQ